MSAVHTRTSKLDTNQHNNIIALGVISVIFGFIITTIAPPIISNAVSANLFDRAPAAGLAVNERTWSITPADYNNDGNEDILIIFHQRSDGKLMRNDGNGSYTRVANTAWPRVNSQGGQFDRHKCAWSDVNHDGLLDTYCSGGRNDSNVVKTADRDNELWLQTAPDNFTDVGTEWGVGDKCGRGRYVAFLDVNKDGWEDLFLGNQAGRPVEDECDLIPGSEQSKIFINNQGTKFVYSPEWNVNINSTGQNCAVPWDYNHDGLIDLLSCNFYNKSPQLFRNTGKGFVESARSLALGAMSDAKTGDLNNDGILDLAYSDGAGYVYRLGTATGLGSAVRLQTLPTSADGGGIAIGDINGDGWQDIYGLADTSGTTGNPDDTVFINNNMSFARHAVPVAAGRGDAVSAVAISGGRSEFLVLNGKLANAGPVQLISWKN